jgi:hypothetical protein
MINDYKKRLKKMPLIICDLEEEKGDLVELKRRPSSARAFSLVELEREINSYDTCANFDLEPFPNTAIHGPQGQKCVSSDYVEFDSKWEAIFYFYEKLVSCDVIERNKKSHLPYVDENGKSRKFYPDFIVNGQFVEVKGILRPTDECKMSQCPNVRFVFGGEIKEMRKILDKKFPKWENDIHERI